jgi:hypothetical protein
MPKHIPIPAGTRCGKAVVIERSGERLTKRRRIAYVCQCDCGDTFLASADNIRWGNVKSCGCIRKHPPVEGPPDGPWRIPLWSDGEIKAYTLVDPEDGPTVAAHSWSLNKGPSGRRTYRAYRWKRLGPGRRNGRNVMLHREILGLTADDVDAEVDHINCDPLDNRRSNLRLVTGAQNSTNRNPRGQSNNTSGVRGVSWESWTGKWRASVKYQGRMRYFGRFETVEEAAEVVQAFRREHMPYSAADQEGTTP